MLLLRPPQWPGLDDPPVQSLRDEGFGDEMRPSPTGYVLSADIDDKEEGEQECRNP